MINWKDFLNVRIFKTLRMKVGAKILLEQAGSVDPVEIDLAELAAVNSIAAADLAKIDGITNGTGAANKAVVLDANGGASIPGELALDGNTLAVTPGVGITGGTGTIVTNSVVKVGSLITTTIIVDLTGLNGGGAAGDIIGTDGAGVAHLGQITAARNGSIFAGKVTCLEVPTVSDPDIDLWSADEATGVEDTAISALTGEVQLTNGGDHTLARTIALLALPVANQYLYLAGGDATAGTYGAGILQIELYGRDA